MLAMWLQVLYRLNNCLKIPLCIVTQRHFIKPIFTVSLWTVGQVMLQVAVVKSMLVNLNTNCFKG